MKFKFWRSSKTGQFVRKIFGLANPDTTQLETVTRADLPNNPPEYPEPHKPLVIWYPLGK